MITHKSSSIFQIFWISYIFFLMYRNHLFCRICLIYPIMRFRKCLFKYSGSSFCLYLDIFNSIWLDDCFRYKIWYFYLFWFTCFLGNNCFIYDFMLWLWLICILSIYQLLTLRYGNNVLVLYYSRLFKFHLRRRSRLFLYTNVIFGHDFLYNDRTFIFLLNYYCFFDLIILWLL